MNAPLSGGQFQNVKPRKPTATGQSAPQYQSLSAECSWQCGQVTSLYWSAIQWRSPLANASPVRRRGAARRVAQVDVAPAVRAGDRPDLALGGEEHAARGGDLDAVDLQAGQQLIGLLDRRRVAGAGSPSAGPGTQSACGPAMTPEPPSQRTTEAARAGAMSSVASMSAMV